MTQVTQRLWAFPVGFLSDVWYSLHMTTTNRNNAIRTTKGTTMTVFSHDLPATIAANKKAAKKARRQARDEMRALFDYDAIRAAAPSPVPVADAFDVYDETEDPEAVYEAFVPAAS